MAHAASITTPRPLRWRRQAGLALVCRCLLCSRAAGTANVDDGDRGNGHDARLHSMHRWRCSQHLE